MNTEIENIANFSCPIPNSQYDKVLLAHGGGGKLTHQLIDNLFYPSFNNNFLNQDHDGAVIDVNGTKIAMTTDSFVINPIFFPGGDIGDLAVNGTVNDIAMCGAKPMYLSLGLIIEEGLSLEDLARITNSIKIAAENANVIIVTGDTKVVERGKADKIYINTSGVGIVYEGTNISPKNCQAGDKIIISGKIAEHGIATLSAREGLQFETSIKSDSAPLNNLVEKMLEVTKNINVLRDPTRGGVSSTLNEIAKASNLGAFIEEDKIQLAEDVKAACEILGFDPLYVANEGKLLAIVSPEDADNLVAEMSKHRFGKDSRIIGEMKNEYNGKLILQTTIGTERIIDMISGEQLPRIC